jgi:hypothetical protein
MPDGTGGKDPDPKASKRNGGPAKTGTDGLTPLERLVAARQAEQLAQRKRDSRVLALLVAVVVVVAGGGVYAWLRFAPPSRHHRTSAGATLQARTTPKASPASSLLPVAANLAFAGSPAEEWPAGAVGIAVPAARAHGPYTAAQVRSAYQTTRQLLIAGNLNWPTLRGGTPTAFADLLTAQQRQQFLAGLHITTLYKNGAAENTRAWITSFAPGTQFVTTVIKVHGTMSAGLATDSGSQVLQITLNYLFVYAVEPRGDPADWLRIVQHEWGDVDFAQWNDPGGPLEPWFSASGAAAGGLCGERDGYIHPDYPHGPPPSVQPSGPPRDPYSLATPSATAGCQQTTGT